MSGSPLTVTLGIYYVTSCWHNHNALEFELYSVNIMAREIRESDWKILRQLHKIALDRFCEHVFSEIEGIAADQSTSPYERYVSLYKTVQSRDKEISNLFDNLKRSTALLQIAALHAHGLLENEEYMRFSEETRAVVAEFLDDND